jgi:hypothetical protein
MTRTTIFRKETTVSLKRNRLRLLRRDNKYDLRSVDLIMIVLCLRGV